MGRQGAGVEAVGRVAAPPALAAAIERLDQAVERFRAGRLTEIQLRAVRVPLGVYEQRQAGVFMLRARCTGGVVRPEHLERLAEVAGAHGNGLLHVTTRQEIQVHGVALDRVAPALRALAAVGLTTLGGGGNTVRNVTTCADAGVCPEEVLDATSHAATLANRLLADPRSLLLPRKYKVGFAGCWRDCGGALVNDLAFVARAEDGIPGFAVYAGGGMGSRPRIAEPLEPFIPAAEVPLVAEAVKRVFDRNGNRKDRRRARLRFLVEQLGFARFRQLYAAERAALGAAAPAGVVGLPDTGPRAILGTADDADEPAALRRWRGRSILPQRQAGLNRVTIPLPLGDLLAGHARALAGLARRFGDHGLRATQDQNLALRSVRDGDLPALQAALEQVGLGAGQPPLLRDLVACAGASWCKLGLCRSRDLATAVSERLAACGLDLDAAGAVKVAISGCPDACGRHPIAAIGLAGAARRVRGRLVPHYLVHLGGRLGEGRTRLAAGTAILPARDVPAFLEDLLRLYLGSPARGDFDGFLESGGRERAVALAAAYRSVPGEAALAAACVDWGSDEPFSLAGRGPGECGAGVLDLIEVDLASADEALRAGRPVAATALAARALLVTRGEQPDTDRDALRLFRREFLESGLVAPHFVALVDDALAAAASADPEPAFLAPPEEVAAFVTAIRALYAGMDASLQFAPPANAAPQPASSAPEPSPAPAAVKDLRGVVCPLNYVKTRLALAPLHAGQVLAVVLDQQGAKNVPASAAADGHVVLSITAEADAFRVLIRKGDARRSS
ncbi:MAG: sulfurtransferase TusA family protein [Deltaproteobacteria bacterium]|nr:sulfurtransferase TusA family protein [Deltaproteobacteria bacterium]